MVSNYKNLGFGLGLRFDHMDQILNKETKAEWFEALSENYMGIPGLGQGDPLLKLEKVRQDFPVVLHGVSMSIGGTDDFNLDYLNQLKHLIHVIEPEWFSDHLCWTGVNGKTTHDLLPLPFTAESLIHVAERIQFIQDYINHPFILENVSSYMEYSSSIMDEAEFLNELVIKTGCGLLVDINNIYVSSINHNFDPWDYIQKLPWQSVAQIHLAGHTVTDDLIIDTHDDYVCDEVWSLYSRTMSEFGFRSSMIEWDDNIPELSILESELEKAKAVLKEDRLGFKRDTELNI